ncbi:hypothetical protein ThvES_00019930 [Thiovulum sp. ES]|nr:hypothetical protein ThvES_00019930 [Thiovulum sp. ES]
MSTLYEDVFRAVINEVLCHILHIPKGAYSFAGQGLSFRNVRVISRAKGKIFSIKAFSAEGLRRGSPLFALMTGSTTSFSILFFKMLSATAAIMFSFESIPVFADETPISSHITSICLCTVSGGRSKTSKTPKVFWAVMEVMALVPKTLKAVNVLRSACIPAPPPLSEPAIVKALGINSISGYYKRAQKDMACSIPSAIT